MCAAGSGVKNELGAVVTVANNATHCRPGHKALLKGDYSVTMMVNNPLKTALFPGCSLALWGHP